MADSAGIALLRQLVATRNAAEAAVNEHVTRLLREGEFVEDIADALGQSREAVRLVRKKLEIPDARDIRREKGLPLRRPGD